jgi:hypothetical protein
MVLNLQRINDNGFSTVGMLEVDGLTFFTMEDTFREVKVYGQTRIPAGRYEIKLRTEGKFHNQYKREFSIHKGCLWLQDVPNFQYVLIHIGNTAQDSSGCILVGSKIVNNDFIGGSTVAYLKLYKHVLEAFENGEQVFIEIKDNK